jgi:hypothetical protein
VRGWGVDEAIGVRLGLASFFKQSKRHDCIKNERDERDAAQRNNTPEQKRIRKHGLVIGSSCCQGLDRCNPATWTFGRKCYLC